MINLGVPVLLIAIVVIVGLRHRAPSLLTRRALATGTPTALSPLDEWVRAQLITQEQADGIRAFEAQRHPPAERRVSLAAEAIGYLGAVLITAAFVVLVANNWEDLRVGGRLAIAAAAALSFAGVAASVRRSAEPALVRLRSVSLFLSAGGAAFFAGLLGGDALEWGGDRVLLFVGAASTAYAGLLWKAVRLELQQLAVFGGVVATAMGAVAVTGAERAAPFAAVLFAVGAGWLALSRWPAFAPRFVAEVLGSASAAFATMVLSGDLRGAGLITGLVVTGGLVALSISWRAPIVLAVGVIGLFIVTPQVVLYFLGDAIGVPAALFASGVVVIVVALSLPRLQRLVTARRN